ncbi:MAG TPA: hypothetical protein VLB44_15115, partial [Kofleriaceae bacterium]|nr:hypothetical protein [Kofleriaceae bacterium]
MSKVALAETPAAPGGGAPVDPYPGDSPPAKQSPPAPPPPADPSPPAQSPPTSAPGPDAATDAAPVSAQTAPAAPTPLPKNALGLTIPPADAIPVTCKSLAKEADALALNRALSARISLASCLANAKLAPIALCDCEQSVRDVEAATSL